MDYNSIHVYGHLLSEEILHQIETDRNLSGNRDADFRLDTSLQEAIDYAWTSSRADWRFYKTRRSAADPYGTRRSREFTERLLLLFGFHPQRQQSYVESDTGTTHDITWLCPDAGNLPVIVKGENTGNTESDGLERCSLDFRTKGNRHEKSAHATMLEYLNNTENIYGIIANGPTLRLIRNSGQLVRLTYIEFDLRRMLEEDKYTEFCLMFRILHASRFREAGDDRTIIEKYFNLSIESGNRIRAGLSKAAQRAMEILGNAAIRGEGEGNSRLRQALAEGALTPARFSKELMHFIYRILFLFIIEDRNLVYDGDSDEVLRRKDIYTRYYAASRFRTLSELSFVRSARYSDMWHGLMDTFRLFEDEKFGAGLGIKPLGGVLFDAATLRWLKDCTIGNDALFDAFRVLNLFQDEKGQWVKINYSSLDVEEFGSVYEGILEMRPEVTAGSDATPWAFGFVSGLDRQTTSSYYTRPDLVQSLIRTTLEPVIKERISKLATPEEKVASLLSMKVCDAASGSGHIVLAMARTIAWHVSSIRSGEDNPASMGYRLALHEVIQKCVYAVDYNPDAVELCKVVLWIEGYCAGKPLSFLDHHIRCGNSVAGVTDLDMLLHGVPDKAFSASDKDTLKKIRRLNGNALKEVEVIRDGKQATLEATLFSEKFNISKIDEEQVGLADKVSEISSLPENSLLEQLTKQRRWEELMQSPRVECLRRACDIYVYAFYHEFRPEDVVATSESNGISLPDIPYTKTVYQALEEIRHLEDSASDYVSLTPEFQEQVNKVAAEQRFFHWCVEFPEVFADGGGFDVMCGNPPWDKLQMEDEKWFVGKDNSIVDAANQAERNKKIKALESSNPNLYTEYHTARKAISNQSKFVKESGRFTLTNNGKIELSSLFAEICLRFSKEAWGLVLPTGITFNDSTKAFFAKLIDENRLISLYDFENRERLFAIHPEYKFCLLTAGKRQEKERQVFGGFFLTRIEHLTDPDRIFKLDTSDFERVNPNTRTAPVFRTSKDAELTSKIYRSCGHVIINEQNGDNPWHIKFGSTFNMSTDSGLFKNYATLTAEGAGYENGCFIGKDGTRYVPLYEGKMFGLYNHLLGYWPTEGERPKNVDLDSPSADVLKNQDYTTVPWYWIDSSLAKNRLIKTDKDGGLIWEWKHNWLIAIRDITTSTTERTFIASSIPDTDGRAVGVGNTATLLFEERGSMPGAVLIALLSSIPFDYVAKQKCGRLHMSQFIINQLPVVAPDDIPEETKWEMAKRVIELTYFNHDMDAWAGELWEEMTGSQRIELPQVGRKEPFIFDPERRAVLQAELDAIVAHLFHLTTEDLRYILDPEDVCGPGCINETFRVLKEREIRELGEYRTRRLVLEAWHRFNYHN